MHDDQVDAWSQAAMRFRRSGMGIFEYYSGLAKEAAQEKQEQAAP
jgi:hypothetical protein